VRKLVNKQDINPHFHPDKTALPVVDDCEDFFYLDGFFKGFDSLYRYKANIGPTKLRNYGN
jgi:hypothetical protein